MKDGFIKVAAGTPKIRVADCKFNKDSVLQLIEQAQLATGLSNVVLDWPLVAAVLHTGGAAALVLVLTWTLVSSRAAPAPQEFSAPTGASRVSA